MWLLTTRGRQKEAQRLLDACAETMTQKAVCYVDGGSYPGLRLPPNWTLVENEQNIGVGPAMAWFYEKHPYCRYFGWLADDFLPITPDWDRRITEAAGTGRIAYCHDGRRPPGSLSNPDWITSAFAIGGDLVRAAGWLSPPGLRQAGIDSAWNRIGRRYGLMTYLHDVRVDHLHWKNGKRPRDATDNDIRREAPLWQRYLRDEEIPAMTRVGAYLDRTRQAGHEVRA